MVVYIDSVFLLNSILDGLLLYFTGYLAGARQRYLRLAAASILGGAYAVSVFLPLGAVAALPPVKLLWGALLLWVAFGGGQPFLRLCILFFALSCVLAGSVVACGYFLKTDLYHGGAYLLPMRMDILLIASALFFAALVLFSRGTMRHRVEGTIYPVTCEIAGQRVTLRTLLDNGNTLRDTATGAPVLVADAAHLRDAFPAPLREYLTEEHLRNPETIFSADAAPQTDIPLRLICYRSVGTASGLLLVCTAYHAKIGAYEAERITVALSPTPVSEQQEYDALWGGPVK